MHQKYVQQRDRRIHPSQTEYVSDYCYHKDRLFHDHYATIVRNKSSRTKKIKKAIENMMTEKIPCAVSTNVSKPEKHGSGRSAVVDYLITTSFGGGGGESESLVRRTFEDFQLVQERLVKERMGM